MKIRTTKSIIFVCITTILSYNCNRVEINNQQPDNIKEDATNSINEDKWETRTYRGDELPDGWYDVIIDFKKKGSNVWYVYMSKDKDTLKDARLIGLHVVDDSLEVGYRFLRNDFFYLPLVDYQSINPNEIKEMYYKKRGKLGAKSVCLYTQKEILKFVKTHWGGNVAK